MNQILTDEEVSEITGIGFEATGRAIEQAILNRLSEQEPIAWLQTSVEYGVDTVIARTYKPDKFNAKWWRFDPLYLHPAPSVPEGYVLVPVVPTGEMNGAGYKAFSISDNPSDCYKAMLSAARSDRELQHEHTMKQFQEVCNGRNCYSSKARPAHSEECKADHDACYAAARSE